MDGWATLHAAVKEHYKNPQRVYDLVALDQQLNMADTGGPSAATTHNNYMSMSTSAFASTWHPVAFAILSNLLSDVTGRENPGIMGRNFDVSRMRFGLGITHFERHDPVVVVTDRGVSRRIPTAVYVGPLHGVDQSLRDEVHLDYVRVRMLFDNT